MVKIIRKNYFTARNFARIWQSLHCVHIAVEPVESDSLHCKEQWTRDDFMSREEGREPLVKLVGSDHSSFSTKF